jgi:uncharacterized membrane protein YhaH (DUF805 family)
MPFDWKSLFSSSGRSDRGRFWNVAALLGIASAVVRLIIQGFGDNPIVLVFVPVLIVMAVIGVNNSIKRLHDLGRSGWWWPAPLGLSIVGGGVGAALTATSQVLGLVIAIFSALATIAFVIALGVLRGDPGANRFGPPPAAEPERDPTAA